jgi:hypothetical protein
MNVLMCLNSNIGIVKQPRKQKNLPLLLGAVDIACASGAEDPRSNPARAKRFLGKS